MVFAFGFHGDDIVHDSPHEAPAPVNGPSDSASTTPVVSVESHELSKWLSALPSHISYGSVKIESPTGRVVHIARRELFNVRQQLMAEDDDATLADLEASDLRTNVYEGGFKTWECSLDLASLILDRGPRKDIDELAQVDSIVELGAGSALPTLVLFQHALQNSYAVRFTLADFNSAVLRLVTLPNLLLAYARFGRNPAIPIDSTSGELDLTPDFVAGFTHALAETGITINLLSGPWSSALLDLIEPSSAHLGTLILAAETIYSPDSTTAFVDLVTRLLKRNRMAKAIVAAKRMYFGIGGSVDGLKEACTALGAVAYEVENSGVKGMDQGVGRALVEIQLY